MRWVIPAALTPYTAAQELNTDMATSTSLLSNPAVPGGDPVYLHSRHEGLALREQHQCLCKRLKSEANNILSLKDRDLRMLTVKYQIPTVLITDVSLSPPPPLSLHVCVVVLAGQDGRATCPPRDNSRAADAGVWYRSPPHVHLW